MKFRVMLKLGLLKKKTLLQNLLCTCIWSSISLSPAYHYLFFTHSSVVSCLLTKALSFFLTVSFIISLFHHSFFQICLFSQFLSLFAIFFSFILYFSPFLRTVELFLRWETILIYSFLSTVSFHCWPKKPFLNSSNDCKVTLNP